MLVDATYRWIYSRAQEVAVLYACGQADDIMIEHWAQHLTDQIRKLNEGGLLSLIQLPLS